MFTVGNVLSCFVRAVHAVHTVQLLKLRKCLESVEKWVDTPKKAAQEHALAGRTSPRWGERQRRWLAALVDQPRTQIKRKGNPGDDLHRTAGPGLLRAVGGVQRASSAAALPSGERSPSTRRV
jgi:hypothetical protein